MTFFDLCTSDPHKLSGTRHKSWAVLVQTRLGKTWRLYRAYSYENVHIKASNVDDCLDVLRIVPISDEQYKTGVARMKQTNAYDQRKNRKTWAGRAITNHHP